MQPASPLDPILVLGAPRSGTTWLAKILDSHPDVLYRHEPDEVVPTPDHPDVAAIPSIAAAWLAERGIRTTTKRPFFAKSYQATTLRLLRTTIAYALNAADRLPEPLRRLSSPPMPDLAFISVARVVFKSVRWCGGAGSFARALPEARVLFILRHPCGQVASVMRGAHQRRFDLREAGTDMPFDEAQAVAFAARRGVDVTAFQALPDAGKYAWSWVAFNETALDGLAGLPNARVVVYEKLCAHPEQEARELLAFVGLDWSAQTEDFIASSTSHTGSAGYYAVFRDSIAAAERWRTGMNETDQEAVLAVVRKSSLSRYWADITRPDDTT